MILLKPDGELEDTPDFTYAIEDAMEVDKPQPKFAMPYQQKV